MRYVSSLTATAVFVGWAALLVYVATAAVDCARGLTVAALGYSMAQRFTPLGLGGRGQVLVFDNTTGDLSVRSVPTE